MNLAVLITCHNRREKTLSCLASLYDQDDVPDIAIKVWLVDDGSSDGTAAAVADWFPEVRILKGTGSLFWCAGMRLAWSGAAAEDPDAFLWLNDDVALAPRALAALRDVARERPDSIVVGSCASPQTSLRSYGGLRRRNAHPGKFYPVQPEDHATPCDTFEGNIVWIPRSAFARIGLLHPYRHSMGDIDYGYRAARAGIPSVVAPGFLGICSNNARHGTWEDRRLPLVARVKKLLGVKGLPPRDWWRFCRAHGGLRAPLYFVGPFLRVVLGR